MEKEAIMDYLQRKLREAGAPRWEKIAEAAGVAKTLPRKIAYGDRQNPGVETIQPLLDFFDAVESGDLQLPEVKKSGRSRMRPPRSRRGRLSKRRAGT